MKEFKFKKFDPSQPLISVHVPKCAGTGFKLALIEAASKKFNVILYYPGFDYHLPSEWNAARNIIHGHFLHFSGHSVENIVGPDAQLTTVVREPYDACISNYHYCKREKIEPIASMTMEGYLEYRLREDYGPLMYGLPKVERGEKVESYATRFVSIGISNLLDTYYKALANILHVQFPPVQIVNATQYISSHEDYRKRFMDRFPFDYDLYNFAVKLQHSSI